MRLQEAYRASVNMREQKMYQEYLTRLRSKDREPLHAPDGTVGPFEHGFTRGTNPADLNFKVWRRVTHWQTCSAS